MGQICAVSGKKGAIGRTYSKRGIAKKKKGIGLKITGKTLRKFSPNLQKKRIWNKQRGCYLKTVISTSALRTMDKATRSSGCTQ